MTPNTPETATAQAGPEQLLAAFSGAGLSSLNQVRALLFIVLRGTCTPSTLSDFLGIHNASATCIADALLARDLITRERSAEDRRKVLYRPTQRTLDLLDSQPLAFPS